MKKQVLTIAIMAVGLLVVSCGNKTGNAAGGADSTAVVKADVKASDVKTTSEKKLFSVGAPEGWEAMSDDDPESTNIMLLKGGMENVMKDAFIIAEVRPTEGETLESGMKEAEEDGKAKVLDDVTAGGFTYKHLYIEEGEMPGHILVAQEGDQFITFTIGKADVDDPDVLAILNSFKLK